MAERSLAAITFGGKTQTLRRWAEERGIKKQTLYYRIFRLGWPIGKAMTAGVRYERHGMTGTDERNIWNSMIQRCLNESHNAYDRYGGRGITVCGRWRESFAAFYEDMGPRPSDKHSLERKDNDKGYEPGNTVWATRQEQSKNTRRNVRITFGGRTMVLKDWARETGLPNQTLWNRLYALGWDVKRALTTPSRGQRGKNGESHSCRA